MQPSASYRVPPALGPVIAKRSPSTGGRASIGMSTSPSGVTPSRSQPPTDHLLREFSTTPISPNPSKSRVGSHRVSSASIWSDLRNPSSMVSPSSRHSPSPDISVRPFKPAPGVLVNEWLKGVCVGTYRCGDLLGQGGFAKVYDFVDIRTGERYACKIVDKEKLKSESTRTKFFAEVEIHQRLKHPNILNFIRYFEDEFYYYLLLERCCRYSMMDLHMSRGVFTVSEIRHIMTQLLIATDFLHSNLVIHRDLKLGNLMIDPAGNIKVGDFGFATQLESFDQLKVTMCGTPNYIAPEVLKPEDPNEAPAGYSFSADIWSLGVILYTLAVGKPPFETKEVQATYNLIRRCEYRFPEGSLTNPSVPIPDGVKAMVSEMLRLRPEDRSSIVNLRCHPFLADTPACAPQSLVDLDAEISPNSRSPVNNVETKYPLAPLRTAGTGKSPSSFSNTQNRLGQSRISTNQVQSQLPSNRVQRGTPVGENRPCVQLSCGIAIVEYAHFPKYGWCYRALQADGRVVIGITLNDCTKVVGDDASNHIWYYNREKSADRHIDKMFFFPSAAEAASFAETQRGVEMSLHKKISILSFLKNHMGPNRDANAVECQVHSTAGSYFSPITKQINNATAISCPSPPVIVKQFQQHTSLPLAPSGSLVSAITMRLSNGLYQHTIHVSACEIDECVSVAGYGLCISPWVIDFSRNVSADSELVNVIFSSQLSRQCFPAAIPLQAMTETAQKAEDGAYLDAGHLRLPQWLCGQIVSLLR